MLPNKRRRRFLIETASAVYMAYFPDVQHIQWVEFKYHLTNALEYKKSTDTHIDATEGTYIRQELTNTFSIEWFTQDGRKIPNRT